MSEANPTDVLVDIPAITAPPTPVSNYPSRAQISTHPAATSNPVSPHAERIVDDSTRKEHINTTSANHISTETTAPSSAVLQAEKLLPGLCSLHGIELPKHEKRSQVVDAKPLSTIRTVNVRALSTIATKSSGLSDAQVGEQVKQYGFNEIIQKRQPIIIRFLLTFVGLSPCSLEAVIIISASLGSYVDAAVVGVLLLVNSILGFIQDEKAAKEVAALQHSMVIEARTKRDGEWKSLPSRELVPGDLVRLRGGDIITSDVIPVAGNSLQIDQSALTGEAMLRSLDPNTECELIFAGSVLKTGECTAIVIATAANTFHGETISLVAKSHPSIHAHAVMLQVIGVACTPLIILVLVAIIYMAVLQQGNQLKEQIPVLLLLIVSGLPVALSAMYTIAQAIGSHILVRSGVLVSRLNATEDAASMTVLCTDKTGTLTLNQLTVAEVWQQQEHFKVAPTAIDKGSGIPISNETLELAKRYPPLLDVILSAARCCVKENSDPIDSAILLHEHAMKSKSDSKLVEVMEDNQIQITEEMVHFFPFDATTRRTEAVLLRTIHRKQDGFILAKTLHRTCKGAPRTLLEISNVSAEISTRSLDAVTQQAKHAYRSIAVAASNQIVIDPKTSNEEIVANMERYTQQLQWTFLGVIALYDPPRADSKLVLQRLKELGVQVIMLTGDSLAVAKEVAHQVGLGREIHALTDAHRAYIKQAIKKHHKRKSVKAPVESVTGASAEEKAKQSATTDTSGQTKATQNAPTQEIDEDPPSLIRRESHHFDFNFQHLSPQVRAIHMQRFLHMHPPALYRSPTASRGQINKFDAAELTAPIVPNQSIPTALGSAQTPARAEEQSTSHVRFHHENEFEPSISEGQQEQEHSQINWDHTDSHIASSHQQDTTPRQASLPQFPQLPQAALSSTPVNIVTTPDSPVKASEPEVTAVKSSTTPKDVECKENNESKKTISKPTETSPSPSPSEDAVVQAQELPFDLEKISGLAELYPSDKHLLVQYLQSCGHVVGMTGDGVNDSPSLKQAEVGCAMSNATDAAKGSASIIFMKEGLSAILPVITVGRKIHRRIVSWVLNKLCKTVTNAMFIVIALLVFEQFPARSIELAIILLLVDFTTLSLSTDHVKPYPKPCKWRVGQLSKVALTIAVCNGCIILGILFIAYWVWDMPWEELHTLSMELMYYVGNFTTIVVREDRNFFRSWPSGTLALTVALEQVILAFICLFGIPIIDVVKSPVHWFFITWGVLAIWSLLFVDNLKILLYKYAYKGFQGYDKAVKPEQLTEIEMKVEKQETLQQHLLLPSTDVGTKPVHDQLQAQEHLHTEKTLDDKIHDIEAITALSAANKV